MRKKTSLWIYVDDWQWCKDKNIMLSYAFKKGIDLLKSGDDSEFLRLKLEKLSIILSKEIENRQIMEEKHAKLLEILAENQRKKG